MKKPQIAINNIDLSLKVHIDFLSFTYYIPNN